MGAPGSRLAADQADVPLVYFQGFCGSLRLRNFTQDLLSGQDPGLGVGSIVTLLRTMPASGMVAKMSLQANAETRKNSEDSITPPFP